MSVHAVFLIKASGQNIEITVKLTDHFIIEFFTMIQVHQRKDRETYIPLTPMLMSACIPNKCLQ